MVDRQWLGDFGWAVLLALQLAALAWSQPLTGSSAAPTKAAVNSPLHDSGRVSLLG